MEMPKMDIGLVLIIVNSSGAVMINFNRQTYVIDLLVMYSEKINDNEVNHILQTGVACREDAYKLSKFVWTMADQMFIDNQSKNLIMGEGSNSDLLTDVDKEVSHYLSDLGYQEIWEDVCDHS